MKTFAVFATVATVLAAIAAEDACDNSLVKPYFHQIGDSMTACENATGINLQSGSMLSLTSDEQSEICSECTDMVELVYTFTWYDCEIAIDGADQVLSTYYKTLVGTCPNTTSSSSGSSTTTTAVAASSAASTASTASSSSSSTSTSVAACDNSLVKPYFHQIGDSMTACENVTSINLQSGSVLSLTSEQQSEICSECTDMVDLAYTFTWYDCEIEIDGADQILSTYFETLVGTCPNSTASGSSDGSTTVTATPSTSTTATSGSPATTPTPTTTSGASSLVSSAALAATCSLVALAM